MKTPYPFVFVGGLLLGIAGGTAGCSPSGPAAVDPAPAAEAAAFPRPAEGEFSVMTFNLHQYALLDRDGDADTLEPKPRKEAESVVAVIRQVSPDVLAVQEMGDPAAWAEFKFNLREAGLEYGHEKYLRRGRHELNIAVLSRFPIAADLSHTDDTYTIGPAQFPVMRGIVEIDVDVNPQYRFRLMVAHLKSKVFHSFGQAEMRRHEARLLGNHVRAALKENPAVNLLVVGDFNDEPSSSPLREIRTYQRKPTLHDLRPVDAVGDAWTHRENNDVHHRIDYVLASEGMRHEVVLDKTYVVRSPLLLNASDHRPLVATFAARELDAEPPPDLSTRVPPDIPQND